MAHDILIVDDEPRVLDSFADQLGNGWSGRSLPRLLR